MTGEGADQTFIGEKSWGQNVTILTTILWSLTWFSYSNWSIPDSRQKHETINGVQMHDLKQRCREIIVALYFYCKIVVSFCELLDIDNLKSNMHSSKMWEIGCITWLISKKKKTPACSYMSDFMEITSTLKTPSLDVLQSSRAHLIP